MKLFGWLRTRPEPPPSDLVDRVERVENAIAKLGRASNDLQLEWESVLDKIARYTARQAARTRRQIDEHVTQASPEAPAPAPEPAPTAGLSKAELRRAYAAGHIRKIGG